MTKVLFEIDGKPTPMRDCSWLMYAPCGCMSGACTVREGAMTADEAWRSFEPNAEQRRRDQKAGFRVQIGLLSDARVLSDDCSHEPKWGVAKTPLPDGHQWARIYRSGQKGGRKHVVPDIGLENHKEHRYDSGDTDALCGASGWYWKAEWWALDGVPECTRCAKKASV
ncbi:hypothetical protein [Amycolatopsis sp. cmx-4-83]|uniref:hypothetical protein n=1 Tax=Amycolatopsis sp. cmx-4-83 TaxID=2790940 RepID=UPI00397DEBDC